METVKLHVTKMHSKVQTTPSTTQFVPILPHSSINHIKQLTETLSRVHPGKKTYPCD